MDPKLLWLLLSSPQSSASAFSSSSLWSSSSLSSSSIVSASISYSQSTSAVEVSSPLYLPLSSLHSLNLSSLSAPSSGICRTMLDSTRADIFSVNGRSLAMPCMGIHSIQLVLGSYARTLPSKISPLVKQMNSPPGSLMWNREGGMVSPNSTTHPCM